MQQVPGRQLAASGTGEEYDEGKRYILKVGQELGLKFA